MSTLIVASLGLSMDVAFQWKFYGCVGLRICVDIQWMLIFNGFLLFEPLVSVVIYSLEFPMGVNFQWMLNSNGCV